MGREEQGSLSEQAMVRQVSRRDKSTKTGGLSLVVMVLLWIGLVGGGFYTSKLYLDKAIQEIKQTNAANVQMLSERIADLNTDIQDLHKVIGNTDAALSSSGSIQMELNNKIEMLTEQMGALEQSLKILKEAPNAKN